MKVGVSGMGTTGGRMVEALLTVARMGLEQVPLPESGKDGYSE